MEGVAGKEVITVYPPSQKTTGLPVDECANNQYATARCRPEAEADNRVVAEGEDGYFSGTTGLSVGLHFTAFDLVIKPSAVRVVVYAGLQEKTP